MTNHAERSTTDETPSGATMWLLYHPPGVVRIVTPAESEALDRVRRAARERARARPPEAR